MGKKLPTNFSSCSQLRPSLAWTSFTAAIPAALIAGSLDEQEGTLGWYSSMDPDGELEGKRMAKEWGIRESEELDGTDKGNLLNGAHWYVERER